MSYFLFANSSRLFGVARTLDLFALFDRYNVSLTPAQADWLALQHDAAQVYQDVWAAYAECIDNSGEFKEAESEELSLAR